MQPMRPTSPTSSRTLAGSLLPHRTTCCESRPRRRSKRCDNERRRMHMRLRRLSLHPHTPHSRPTPLAMPASPPACSTQGVGIRPHSTMRRRRSGLLLSAPGQQGVMRRAHSGNQTPTLASTSYLQTPPASSAQTTATRVRRRRQSIARDDASRPASRASATSRPDSALSFNDDENPQPDPGSAQTRDAPRRSRTESAPAAQRRSQNAFASPVDTAPSGASRPHPQPALQQSLHRQNVWNDITEDDPDDLPPPFPEGAPRPPTPPQPPSHSEAAADAQLIAPQPHTRIPDSPPPPFVSDDEDEPSVGGQQQHKSKRGRGRAVGPRRQARLQQAGTRVSSSPKSVGRGSRIYATASAST